MKFFSGFFIYANTEGQKYFERLKNKKNLLQ